MRFRPRHIVVFVSVLAVALGMLVTGPVVTPAAAAQTLRWITPTDDHLEGTVDLRVDAPEGTTAVRFFIDDVRLSEVTDSYRRQTKTDAPWMTATDVGWFPAGAHTLRVEADTPTGSQTLTKRVLTRTSERGPGLQSLNGGWSFSPASDLPKGAAEGTAPVAVQSGYDATGWSTIVVPDSIGAVEDDWNDDDGMVGVYRRTVQLVKPEAGERTALVFQSCFWFCRYFVNGTEVGTSTGGYLPTRLDVTEAVKPGGNVVAVIVDNRVSTMGEYARPVQGLYWNYGGLLQEAHLERTPAVALTETRAEGTLAGRLTLRPTGVNGTSTAKEVAAMVSVAAPDGARVMGPTPVRTTVPAGGGAATPITLDVPGTKAWDLDHPNLYTVTLRAQGDAAWRPLIERTGFRDVAVKGLDITLNGKPVENLQGFNRHADYPGLGRTQSNGLADREIKEMRDKGFQLFRPAHYPTTPAELDAADRYGLLVIEEINNISAQPGSFLGRTDVQDFGKRTLSRMVDRDRSHPSVFAWSVGNENATETDGGVDYVRNVIAHGRSIDPSRLYTQVSHRHTADRAYPYQDFFATNYYAGWYSTLDSLTSHMDAMQKMTHQPLVLSEYGAEAVYQRKGTGRGTEWYQASLVDEHNRLLGKRPHLLGLMYWTSTEFWCTPTWSGGNPEPVPPFHTKGLQTLFRDHKLGWRVMFSPVRISQATVVEAPMDSVATLRQRVTLTDARGTGAKGTVVVDPPEGFTATSAPFSVARGGTTTVEVTLTGSLTQDNIGSQGFVRAVVDSDTEALPAPFTIRSIDTVGSPASDDFNSSQLDSGWDIVRPDASGWNLTDRAGSLRLSTLPGSETGTSSNGRNLFVRTTTPETDFTAAVTVDAPEISADFQQVGLYAYGGDDDYVKVDLGWVDGRRAIELLAESGGSVRTRKSVPYDGESAQLRLVRRGDDVTAEYSGNGTDWFALGTAALPGSPRVALQAAGGSASPPVVPTYVDDLVVRTSGDVAVERVAPTEPPLFGGEPSQVGVTVSNGSDHAVPVEARLEVPEGWQTGNAAATVPAFGRVTIQVPVTAPDAPEVARLTARVTAVDVPVRGTPSAQVLTAPRGDQVALALDAGTATSPLLDTYSRLSPSDTWDEAKGYGWIGAVPQSRDRGAPDPLSRDLVTNTAKATLRVAVPAGPHDLYLLVGDNSFATDPMSVSVGGTVVVQVPESGPTGEFRWLRATLDGGPSGRTVDLDFAANDTGRFWRFSSLVLARAEVP